MRSCAWDNIISSIYIRTCYDPSPTTTLIDGVKKWTVENSAECVCTSQFSKQMSSIVCERIRMHAHLVCGDHNTLRAQGVTTYSRIQQWYGWHGQIQWVCVCVRVLSRLYFREEFAHLKFEQIIECRPQLEICSRKRIVKQVSQMWDFVLVSISMTLLEDKLDLIDNKCLCLFEYCIPFVDGLQREWLFIEPLGRTVNRAAFGFV